MFKKKRVKYDINMRVAMLGVNYNQASDYLKASLSNRELHKAINKIISEGSSNGKSIKEIADICMAEILEFNDNAPYNSVPQNETIYDAYWNLIN